MTFLFQKTVIVMRVCFHTLDWSKGRHILSLNIQLLTQIPPPCLLGAGNGELGIGSWELGAGNWELCDRGCKNGAPEGQICDRGCKIGVRWVRVARGLVSARRGPPEGSSF